MSKKKLKYIIFLVVVIFLLFICSVFLILSIKKYQDSKVAPVEENDVSFVADSNTIIIKNIISVSEDFGKSIHEENGGAFGYLEFDVVNRTNLDRNYQIYITKLDSTVKEINSSYMTFYLTNYSNVALDGFTGNKLPSFDELNYIKDKADSKRLYQGSLSANQTEHFILRVWIADNYVVSNTEESFSFEIGARAV